MLHIETELEDYRAKRKAKLTSINERKDFMETLTSDAREALSLHGKALEDEQRELGELDELIAKQENAIAAQKIADDNPELIQSPS